MVERQHLVGDIDRGDVRARLGPFRDELAEVAVARAVAARRMVVEDVVRGFREQCHRAMVAAQEGARAVGQVTELVRIDGDRVARGQCLDRRMHVRAREAGEAFGHGLARAQAAIGFAEQGREVAAPGGIDMHREPQAARQPRVARGDQGVDRVDRAVLGGAEHADRGQHRLAQAQASLEGLLQRRRIQPHVAFGHQPQLRATQPEQLHPLRPRVVRGDRREHPRYPQVGMRGEEIDQTAALDAFGFDLRFPCAVRARGLSRQPVLPAHDQRGRRRRPEVECRPVVVREVEVGHAGGAQRDRERLQRQRQPQRLVVGQGAAGGEVAERTRVAVGIVRIADHPRQLQADFDLEVDGYRRRVLADVVGVVGQGQDLRGQAGQQQVRGHVPDVARAVERHRLLERGGQLVQLAAHARLERAVAGVERGVGGDRRRILGMEVAPPVDVVAQELDDQLLQQAVVLGVGAEEAGVEHAGGGGRRIHGGGR